MFPSEQNNQLRRVRKKTAAASLAQYINYLSTKKKREALANFTTIFEKGTYEKAIAFMVVNAPAVYEMLNQFVDSLAGSGSSTTKSKAS